MLPRNVKSDYLGGKFGAGIAGVALGPPDGLGKELGAGLVDPNPPAPALVEGVLPKPPVDGVVEPKLPVEEPNPPDAGAPNVEPPPIDEPNPPLDAPPNPPVELPKPPPIPPDIPAGTPDILVLFVIV